MFKYFMNHYEDETDEEWWNTFRYAMQEAANLVKGDAHKFAIDYALLLEKEMVNKYLRNGGK
jgi:hypothetical protein